MPLINIKLGSLDRACLPTPDPETHKIKQLRSLVRHKTPNETALEQFNFCVSILHLSGVGLVVAFARPCSSVPMPLFKRLVAWARTQNICCLGGEYVVCSFLFRRVSSACPAVLQWWKLSHYARSNRSIFPLFIQSFTIESNEITVAPFVWSTCTFYMMPVAMTTSLSFVGGRIEAIACALRSANSWTTFCRCGIECAQSSKWGHGWRL